MIIVRFLLSIGLLLLLVPVGERFVTAQDQTPRDTEPILRIESNLLMVEVTVSNVRGEYVSGLKADDFTLFEDGTQRQIEFFQAFPGSAPRQVAMVFAIDFSGSVTSEESRMQQRSLLAFLERQHPESLFGLIAFNNDVKVLENLGRDRQKLLRSFQKYKDYGGSTRIYDGIDRAITMLKKAPRDRANNRLRRIVVVLTDGFDSSSIADTREVIRRANENEVTVYSVTVPSYALTMQGKLRVPTPLDASRIVEGTGGRDFAIEPGKDYTTAFRAISAEVAASYTLGFYPPTNRRTTTQHKINVAVRQPDLTLRLSRDGYVSAPAARP